MAESVDPTGTSAWSVAVVHSGARLADAVTRLSADQLGARSGASEWSIGDVLSHLGSQAEIFVMFLDAGRDGTDAPGLDRFQPVWDVWNAKSAVEQRDDYLAANAAFIARLDAMDDAAKASWHLNMFGAEQELQGLLQMRLGEYAMHSWDVSVGLDPSARVDADAVDLLVDTLPALAARAGRAPEQPVAADLVTSDPKRHFVLRADADGVTLDAADGPAGTGAVGTEDRAPGTLVLPAEVLVRLVYGRAGDADATAHPGLETLRPLFPGV